jgi:hypothetical protein
MADPKRGSKTLRLPSSVRGSGPPPLPSPSEDDLSPPTVKQLPPELAPSLMDPPPRSRTQTGGIEVHIVREGQGSQRSKKPWRAAEVWTKNRIYGLDSTMKCIDIIHRETGKPEEKHTMLGTRLGGGRLREGGLVRFSYPFPLPGMEAMFTEGKKCGYTSVVERFIVRIRVLYTRSDDAQPSWEDIASRWPESKRR